MSGNGLIHCSSRGSNKSGTTVRPYLYLETSNARKRILRNENLMNFVIFLLNIKRPSYVTSDVPIILHIDYSFK